MTMIRVNLPGSVVELPAAQGPNRTRIYPPEFAARVEHDFTERRQREDEGDPRAQEQRRRGGLHRWGKYEEDDAD